MSDLATAEFSVSRRRSLLYVYGSRLPNTAANSGAVASLCIALHEAGFRVTLAYPKGDGDADSIRSAYAIPAGVRLAPVQRGRSILAYPVLLASALFRSGVPDVVITRAPEVAALCSLASIPTALELHQEIATGKRWPFWRRLLLSAPRPRLSILSSAPSIQNKIDPAVSAVALDMTLAASSAPDLAEEAPRVPAYDLGYIGSFMAGKGVDLIFALAEARPGIRFVLYGDASVRPDLVSRAKSCPNLTLAGPVPRRDLSQALASFRIGLAPYGREGFAPANSKPIPSEDLSSLKIVEYMSASCVVIASNLSAVSRIIIDNVHGLLCDPDDARQWIAAIDRVMEDPILAEKLRLQGRQRYEERYSIAARAAAFARTGAFSECRRL